MILAVLQARFTSSRLPGKVLKNLLDKPMLLHEIQRVKQSKMISQLIVATSVDATDDAIEKMCREHDIQCFRGSLDDVLDRFYQAALLNKPEHIVRLTGDCPLIDPVIIDEVIAFHLKEKAQYTSNAIEPTFPDGLDVEIFEFDVLKQAWNEAKLTSQREHVTPFIHSQPSRFKISHYKNKKDHSHMRWTVDNAADFELVEKVYSSLYPENQKFGMDDIINFLEKNPQVSNLNKNTKRNEGFEVSLKKDIYQKRYEKSLSLLTRATQTIPLGSQTFSKSKTQYPLGVSPYFIQKGKGCHVWDVDGNKYVDFVNGLCAVNLGYGDSDVNNAVRNQLEDGVIFTLPHPLEMQVAEKIKEMVPCAEMVRFGKNGSDATSGAIRLARAYTNRDHVAMCGYHGWQDWYIGATARNRGVPKATRDLSHTFTYNDLSSLEKIFQEFPNQIAAVILEPMNVTEPKVGFLQGVKDLAAENGAVLVFDETITGFRFAKGGAQEFFGVTPDLATFGKGIANGFPVSAVAGKREIMKLMEEIFFSFTFGGETLSLAAALATMEKMQKEPVIEHFKTQGNKIIKGVEVLITKYDIGSYLSISGNPAWSFLNFKDKSQYSVWQIKTLFFQEIFLRGVLTLGTHNLSYSHKDEDITHLLKTYDEVFGIISQSINNGDLEKQLQCKPLEPLFKVR
ncbi:MAG: aminotransferase class III-fold pyridoxal phosphate-dependent enzyme [Oligoflexia bacterium]|nr:aminotransferase class III-fold pyridoxal phosphate-dependent enzyme [Oligoflexia bacterium]